MRTTKSLWWPWHWPSWAAVGLFRLLALLPFRAQSALGKGIGWLGFLLAGQRRQVARINLSICLPELDAAQREALLCEHFGWLGVAAVCQGLSWSAPPARVARLVRFQHPERLESLLQSRRPVILLVPHFLGLELAATALSALVHPGMYMYQRIRNPVIDAQMRRARTRFGAIPVERQDDLRGLIRIIKTGVPFFYLPDQDPGRRRGVFVPFCGVPAATVPTLGRLARLSGAVVLPTFARFLPRGAGLEICFDRAIEAFPSHDVEFDAARMNQVIEARLRSMPAQYFWVHRRFKTRPEGAEPIYPVRRQLRRRR
jgi:KDO2-lipid IV(A) lauroyltransferase